MLSQIGLGSAEPKKPKKPELKNHKSPREKNSQLACFAFHLQAVKCLGCMACLVKIVQLTPFFLSFSSISLLSANHYLCRRSVPWEAKKIYRNNFFFTLSSFSAFAYNEKKVELSMPFQDVLKFMEYEAAQILRFV